MMNNMIIIAILLMLTAFACFFTAIIVPGMPVLYGFGLGVFATLCALGANAIWENMG